MSVRVGSGGVGECAGGVGEEDGETAIYQNSAQFSDYD